MGKPLHSRKIIPVWRVQPLLTRHHMSLIGLRLSICCAFQGLGLNNDCRALYSIDVSFELNGKETI
jgi:hypothetical protein